MQPINLAARGYRKYGKNWQHFAISHDLTIQVCVSAALARGVTDADNATRHQLQGDNLADGFELVGLGELAMHLHRAKRFISFNWDGFSDSGLL